MSQGTGNRLAAGLKGRLFPIFLLVSLVYAGLALNLNQARMFWEDELYTLYESRLPTFSALWGFLRSSTEANTPVFMGITQWLAHRFGESPVVLRAPGLFAYWLMVSAIYWIVAKRQGALWGASAAFLVIASRAFPYSAEARAYGFVMGTSALALWCWLWAWRNARSNAACLCLAASVCLAVSSHYYAILTPLPLMLAQAVNDVRVRRVAWRIWLAFAAGALPILISLPLIRASRSYMTHFWSPPNFFQLLNTYSVVIGPELGAILAVALLAAVCWGRPASESAPDDVAVPEWVALWGFVFLPLAGWLLAVFITHGYVERYVLQPAFGIAILFGLGLGRKFGGASRVALASAMALCCIAILWCGLRASGERAGRDALQEIPQLVDAAAPRPLPVAVSTVDLWLRLDHYYGSSKNARYFTYLSDRDMAEKYLNHDATEVLLQGHPELYPKTLRMFRPFLAAGEPFLVFSSQPDWLSKGLVAAKWRLRMLGHATGGILYLAEPPLS
jgi:hypothetical protein